MGLEEAIRDREVMVRSRRGKSVNWRLRRMRAETLLNHEVEIKGQRVRVYYDFSLLKYKVGNVTCAPACDGAWGFLESAYRSVLDYCS